MNVKDVLQMDILSIPNSTNEVGVAESDLKFDLVIFQFVLVSIIILMTSLWLVYFINHTLLARQKIYYLKYHARSCEMNRLVKSHVDYRRSLLICAILLLAVLGYLCLMGQLVYLVEVPSVNVDNCTLTFPFDYTYHSIPYRILLYPSKIIFLYIVLSLIVIMTSYLHKAYDVKRRIRLREWNLFVWMCVEVVVILLIHITWRTFFFLYPIVTVMGIIKLIVLARKIQQMNNVLKPGVEETHYESDKNSNNNMKRMYCQYFIGSWGVFFYLALYVILNGILCVLERVRLVITSTCVIHLLTGYNIDLYSGYIYRIHMWTVLFRVGEIIESILCIIMFFMVFILHMGIFKIFLYRYIVYRFTRCHKSKTKRVKFADPITQPFIPK
ncbi:hypothetical protein LOD99_15650 [Oopsacas minuta]|uniref:G-protein coupled receptors family 1 profile domain-containing protein n=1 Tax=Oopsacas minuta TaxID=111878 RepID=A0AAV7K9K2_9METZ|nr:hypothetical protein LOD99_15650 [Oopsacas minuta]